MRAIACNVRLVSLITLGRKNNVDRAVAAPAEAPTSPPQSGEIGAGGSPQKLTAKFWIALFWLVSAGLHGIALLLPMPSSEPPIGEKSVKIVQLPPPKLPVAQRPNPKPALPVAQPAQLQPTVAAKVETPRSPALEVKQPVQPSPAPSPTPVASPTSTPSATPQAQPSPKASPTPITSPSPSPTPTDTLTAIAQSAGGARCNEAKADCYRIPTNPGTNWRAIADDRIEKFKQSGHQVKEREDLEEAGLRVFELSKNGDPKYYLHISSSFEGIVLLKRPTLLTKEQVDQEAS
jgi:hypothetical protein